MAGSLPHPQMHQKQKKGMEGAARNAISSTVINMSVRVGIGRDTGAIDPVWKKALYSHQQGGDHYGSDFQTLDYEVRDGW